MAAPFRWVRLDIGWSSEGWITDLPPASRLAWVELLCHVKACGTVGRAKRPSLTAKARHWDIPIDDIRIMEEAAIRAGALTVEEGEWVVAGWPEPSGRGLNRWKRVRLEVLERDGWTCRYCGKRATHCDHVLPRSRGGADDLGNLVAACGWCNRSKSDLTPEEWERVN